MATDIEESDTEDHERPAPPKRQCINIININNEKDDQSVPQSAEQSTSLLRTDNEPSDHENILKYHDYLIDRHCYLGSVDNTINRAMETYMLIPPSERARLQLFREAEMEDRAVMMAIHNHGLVHSVDEALHDHWSSDDTLNFPSPVNNPTDMSTVSNDTNSACATSSKMFATRTFQDFNREVTWGEDNKFDDGDEQQAILERAVAEAIKIKGLSALSVDDG